MTRTTEPAFNLLDEPWIPIRRLNGECCDVSLTEALIGADTIANLTEPSPTSLIALHRLLLAVLHRALSSHHGHWKDADRTRWYREGLPEDAIRAYLDQWRERFWLIHPKEPFMQVAGLADWEETSSACFSVSSITINLLYGSSLFEHEIYDAPALDAALALRRLLGYLQFTPGGFFPGKKLKSSERAGPVVNSAAILPLGDTLAHTLLLGLHPAPQRQPDDLPAWERQPPSIGALRANAQLATGPNDRYTRQTRAILFVPEETADGIRIRQVFVAAGLSLEDDEKAPDPMVSSRLTKDGKVVRVSFQEGRAFWRELPTLVPDASGKFSHPAAILLAATNLYERLGRFDIPVPVLVAGLASDQAKLLRWRIDRFDLPLPLLAKPEAAAEFRDQIRYAEDVYFRLRAISAEMIAETMPDPSHKDTRARARAILDNGSTAPVFFSATERALAALMQCIAAGDVEGAHQHWRQQLKFAVQRAWSATGQALGDSPRVMRAIARADPSVRRLIRSLEQPAMTSEETSP